MQLCMKTTGNPVPFFVSLYFSVGFFGYVVARFQLNRHNTPFQNTLEYIRQGASVIVKANILGTGLASIRTVCFKGVLQHLVKLRPPIPPTYKHMFPLLSSPSAGFKPKQFLFFSVTL